MIKLSQSEQIVLETILKNNASQSSAIHQAMIDGGKVISLVSIKRALSEMAKKGVLELHGAGRSTSYSVTTSGRVFADIDAEKYAEEEPDKRFGLSGYNFELLSNFPPEFFDEREIGALKTATKEYREKTKKASLVIQEKELQRLIIELSWKSSKIEGNTYTLLDTEKLILEQKEAPGHSKSEAKMILNHKDAFNFVRENSSEFKTLTPKYLEKLHSILVKDLGVSARLRNGLVGITGSKYKPLDNIYQIKEAIEALSLAVSKTKTPYDKALLALIGISYIQPFEDGNKRTGRLMANALLLAHGCAPLSYRSVEEKDYRAAILAFYEINTIIPMKKIFLEQYLFAAKNYAVK